MVLLLHHGMQSIPNCIHLLNYPYNITLQVYLYLEKMAKDASLSRMLTDKSNTKSQVWKHIGLVPDNDGIPKGMGKLRCKLCFK